MSGSTRPDATVSSSPQPSTAKGTAATEPAPPKNDVVLLGPPTADGAGVHVLRARDERLEAGELRALQEGRPVTGEVVTLRPREGNPRVCDVADSYVPEAASTRARTGPAQVATPAYRENWDEIFGRRDDDPKRRALN